MDPQYYNFAETPDDESQQLMAEQSVSLQNFDRSEFITLNEVYEQNENLDILIQIQQQGQVENSLYIQLEKKLLGQQSTDQEIQQLTDVEKTILEQMTKKQVQKRKEEKQKFIFKKAFKRIEQLYYSRQNKQKKIRKDKDKKDSLEFYNYYFKDVAQSCNVPLSHFIHPQKKVKTGTQLICSGYKSFSQPYIKLILQSKQFKQEIKNYISGQFQKDCQSEMKQKLRKFIDFCDKIQAHALEEFYTYYAKNDDEEFAKNFVRAKLEQSILKNSKCKVPWSYQEVLDVQKFAVEILEVTIDEEL